MANSGHVVRVSDAEVSRTAETRIGNVGRQSYAADAGAVASRGNLVHKQPVTASGALADAVVGDNHNQPIVVGAIAVTARGRLGGIQPSAAATLALAVIGRDGIQPLAAAAAASTVHGVCGRQPDAVGAGAVTARGRLGDIQPSAAATLALAVIGRDGIQPLAAAAAASTVDGVCGIQPDAAAGAKAVAVICTEGRRQPLAARAGGVAVGGDVSNHGDATTLVGGRAKNAVGLNAITADGPHRAGFHHR